MRSQANNGYPVTLSRAQWPSGETVAQANVGGTAHQLSRVLSFKVPPGYVLEPDPRRLLYVLLGTAETVELTGGGSENSTTYPIARVFHQNGDKVTDGKNADVVLTADGTARTITAIQDHVDDVTAGTITTSDDTNADHQMCYPPFSTGKIVIRVEAPGGAGDQTRELLSVDIKTLQGSNQLRDGNPLLWGAPLTEQFRISVLLDAVWTAAFETGATGTSANLEWSDVQIPGILVPVRYYAQKGETVVGETAMRDALDWIAV